MKANEFMSKIDKGEIEFNSIFASGTFGWEFDFAEAYAEYQLKEAKELLENAQPIWKENCAKWAYWYKRLKELI